MKITRVPLVYSASEIVNWHVSEQYEPGKWRPARCCGFNTLSWDHIRMRFRLAWRVFLGQYDCLNWGKGSGEEKATDTNYRDCTDPRWLRSNRMTE